MTEEEHELPILLVAPAPARHAGERLPMLLLGSRSTPARPISSLMQLMRFDGTQWALFGNTIG